MQSLKVIRILLGNISSWHILIHSENIEYVNITYLNGQISDYPKTQNSWIGQIKEYYSIDRWNVAVA